MLLCWCVKVVMVTAVEQRVGGGEACLRRKEGGAACLRREPVIKYYHEHGRRDKVVVFLCEGTWRVIGVYQALLRRVVTLLSGGRGSVAPSK